MNDSSIFSEDDTEEGVESEYSSEEEDGKLNESKNKQKIKEIDSEMKDKLLELKSLMKRSGLSESMSIMEELISDGNKADKGNQPSSKKIKEKEKNRRR